MFRSVVAVNPVTNLPAMAAATDMPDWVYVESGLPYAHDVDPISCDEYGMMMDASPVSFVNSIRCPVLFQIGDNDLRVPPSQGYSMYYMLKARGAKVE